MRLRLTRRGNSATDTSTETVISTQAQEVKSEARLFPWIANEFGVWHVRQELRTYLGYTAIHTFQTGGDAPLRTCAFCDAVSTNGRGTCSQCGAPLGCPNGQRSGKMLLRSLMPFDCDTLTTLHSGDRIELHHSYCGRLDDYENGHVAAMLTVDKIEGPSFGGILGGYDWCGDGVELEVTIWGIVGMDFTDTEGQDDKT